MAVTKKKIQNDIAEINNLLCVLVKYCESNIKIEEIEIIYPLVKIISDKTDNLEYYINNLDNL